MQCKEDCMQRAEAAVNFINFIPENFIFDIWRNFFLLLPSFSTIFSADFQENNWKCHQGPDFLINHRVIL